jgi:uracil-DNA glycosylase
MQPGRLSPACRRGRPERSTPLVLRLVARSHRQRLADTARGRLDGTARVLVLGQDPSTNEILAQRALVGTSGQRVQKLLAKIGITRSYVSFNTFLFSVLGQFDTELRAVSLDPEILDHRNRCLDRIRAQNPVQR